MPDPELYVGLAGVAVVFAGFAGISAVLIGRDPGEWREVDRARLSGLIELSIGTAMFALLPLVIAGFTASVNVIWAFASAVFLAHTGLFMVRSFRIMRRTYRDPDTDRAPRFVVGVTFLFVLISILALAMNAFALGIERSGGPYFLALVVNLGLSARMFMRSLVALR